MKISEMDPMQAREIDALYEGAKFIASDADKQDLARIMEDDDLKFEDMAKELKVFINQKIKQDQNVKAYIEMYFRLRQIAFHYVPDWRL